MIIIVKYNKINLVKPEIFTMNMSDYVSEAEELSDSELFVEELLSSALVDENKGEVVDVYVGNVEVYSTAPGWMKRKA